MVTTRTLLNELVKTLSAQYAEQLERLPMKKSTREALAGGFQDGAQQTAHHVCAMLGVTVKAE